MNEIGDKPVANDVSTTETQRTHRDDKGRKIRHFGLSQCNSSLNYSKSGFSSARNSSQRGLFWRMYSSIICRHSCSSRSTTSIPCSSMNLSAAGALLPSANDPAVLYQNGSYGNAALSLAGQALPDGGAHELVHIRIGLFLSSICLVV